MIISLVDAYKTEHQISLTFNFQIICLTLLEIILNYIVCFVFNFAFSLCFIVCVYSLFNEDVVASILLFLERGNQQYSKLQSFRLYCAVIGLILYTGNSAGLYSSCLKGLKVQFFF